jgi:hypothetical protein
VLRKFLAAFPTSFHFAQARSLAARHKPHVALEILRKAFASLGATAPSVRAPIVMNAFYASLCSTCGEREAAYSACEMVIFQINDHAMDYKTYSPHDILYLLYWTRYELSGLSEFIDSAAWGLALDIPVTFESLELRSTSRFLTRLFPISPDWAREVDDFVTANRAVAQGQHAAAAP